MKTIRITENEIEALKKFRTIGIPYILGVCAGYALEQGLISALDTIIAQEAQTAPDDKYYRFLKAGEIIRYGDQWRDSKDDEWKPTILSGETVLESEENEKTYRRKISQPTPKAEDVGEGYRQLLPHEIVEDGDELRFRDIVDDEWDNTSAVGYISGDAPWFIYRRKVKISEPSPTRAEIGDDCRILYTGETIQVGDEIWMGNEWQSSNNIGGVVNDGTFRRKRESAGKGYRHLRPGEEILKGDEIWCCGDWTPTIQVGCNVTDGTFRRKIFAPESSSCSEVGEGYRKLQPSEIIAVGDECHLYTLPFPQWGKSCYAGDLVSWHPDFAYRRKILRTVDKAALLQVQVRRLEEKLTETEKRYSSLKQLSWELVYGMRNCSLD